jgi:repressor LexA
MLTTRQRDLLVFLSSHVDERGVMPAYQEMAKAIGIASKSGIHRMVLALEERGHIKRIPYRARAIEIVKRPDTASNVTKDSVAFATEVARTLSISQLEAIIAEKRPPLV